MTRQDLRQQGIDTLQRLFGSSAQAPGLANLLTEPVFGGVWNRPGLALPDRMLCVIAALSTIPRLRPLRRHIVAGLELGLTPEAIREILVQPRCMRASPPPRKPWLFSPKSWPIAALPSRPIRRRTCRRKN